MIKQLRRISATALLSLILTGCVSVQTTQPGAIGLDRVQRMSPLVSEQELRQGSAAAYTQVLGEARQKGSLNTNAELTRRVRSVADRLIPQSAVFRKDAVNWDWQVNGVLPTLLGLESATDIWATLATSYGRPSESRILQLQMQLQNNRHVTSEDVAIFLRQAKLLTDELAAAGALIPTRIFNMTVYNNLGADFGVEAATTLAVGSNFRRAA